jgi:hypothetical protein
VGLDHADHRGDAAAGGGRGVFRQPAGPLVRRGVLGLDAMDVVALWGLCVYGSRQNIEAAA